MHSHDAEPTDRQAATPGRAAYEPPMIEVFDTVDGVIATAPGATIPPTS